MPAGELDEEYEIESKIPDLDSVVEGYRRESEEASHLAGARLDLQYGPDPRHKLDLFPPDRPEAPVQIFYHGGYWRGGAKEERRFPAMSWLDRGMAWVSVEYRLAPHATLDEIVDDCRTAFAWFYAHAHELGCDRDRLAVSGNSAGGHIVGMLAADGWQDRYALPRDAVKAACAVSGLFDLEPIRRCFVNDWLSISESAAQRNSPMAFPPRPGLPMLIAVGGLESHAFKGQTAAYADMCRAVGADVAVLESPDTDHMRIIGQFGQPQSALFRAIEACWRRAGLIAG